MPVLKILLKSAILVFIILSVYFIVHPSACSNLMLGRVTNTTDREPAVEQAAGTHGELFTPQGDKPLNGEAAEPLKEPEQTKEEDELFQEQEGFIPQETPSAEPEQGASTAQPESITPSEQSQEAANQTSPYSQEDIDYAIARRYVELEQEYARLNKIGKDTAKEIAYKVMDDFEMTQQEWEAFLLRATEGNLFNKIRLEVASGK